MKEFLPYLISACALLISFANSHYTRKRDTQNDWNGKLAELASAVIILKESGADSKERLKVLEMQMSVYWRSVGVASATALHSPHTKALDVLLEKFQRDELANERELTQLKLMLSEIVEKDADKWRQKLASDILTTIRLRFEIGGEVIGSGRMRKIEL